MWANKRCLINNTQNIIYLKQVTFVTHTEYTNDKFTYPVHAYLSN